RPRGAAGGLLAGLAARYALQQELRLTPAWLALRLATGGAAGLLAAAAAEDVGALAPAAGAAVVLGAAAMLLRPAVRRLAFAGRRVAAEPGGEAG
ncbi:MAG: hypothetical protein WD341_00460, partial [Tistlia sp.]|uniref:hypothetical protein n=1 Tax=Tistlia sp. TaxID=3057121 RepID=UPI0034A570CB